MQPRLWTAAAVLTLLPLGLPACGGDDDVKVETLGAIPDESEMRDTEAQLDAFLTDYVAEDPRFADDPLDYDIVKGVVTIRGTVDSEAERDALAARVRRVPGIRDVDVTKLTIMP